MKHLFIIALVFVATLNVYGQEIEATSEKFHLDYSNPLEVTWVFPSEQDTLLDYRDIVMKVGYTTKHEIKDVSLLLNGLPVTTEHRGLGFVKKSHPVYDELIEQNITLHEGGNVLKFAVRGC